MTIPAPAFQLPAGIAPATPPSPQPAAPVEPVVPMALLADKYRQLRDRKDALKKQHAEELSPITTVMDQLEALMQRQLEASNASSVRTEHGTVIRAVRQSFSVEDPGAFRAWAEINGLTTMYENRVSKEAIEEYVAKGNPLPPGIKTSAVTTIQVRKN